MSRRLRRCVLKGLTVALPAAWVRPVVEAVILPAHARTSVRARCSCSIEGAAVDADENTFSVTYSWGNWMALSDGQAKISVLGREVGISQRQLSRKYRKVVGIRPKFYSRVLQAHMAFEHLVKGDIESLARIAQTCGYYDQAHFVRAIQEIFRCSPAMILPKSPGYLLDFLQDSHHHEIT